MIISKAAVLAIAAFCPSRAYDNSQQKSFDSLSSSKKSKRMNKEATSAISPRRLTHYPFPSSEEETLSTAYTKVEVLANKPKSHYVTSVVGEGQEDDFFSTFEDQSVDAEGRAVSGKVDQELELVQHGQNNKDEAEDAEDANVGILSFHWVGDNYRYDNKESARRRLDLISVGTGSCDSKTLKPCDGAGGFGGEATIGNYSCNGDFSCYLAGEQGQANIGNGSCKDEKACLRVGYDGIANIGNRSCTDYKACYDAAYDGIANIGNRSCTERQACHYAGKKGQANIGYSSCTDERSCNYAGNSGIANIGYSSCTDAKSCNYAGNFGIANIGDTSCTKEKACSYAGSDYGRADIGNTSCTYKYSCFYAGDNKGQVSIDNDSCTGYRSCYLAGSTSGQATIGKRSCTSKYSCQNIGRLSGAVVVVGDDSCTKDNSCSTSTESESPISFTIGKNSCKCKECCQYLPDGSDIGDGQCNSISDGCSNQDEPVLRPSSCADLNEYSCEFSLYIIDEDGGDKEDDGQKTVTVSTKTAICVKRTDTKKGKIEYRNECVSNEDILGLSSGSPLSSSKPNVEESIFSCGCCQPDAIPDDEEEEEEEHSKKSYKNNKIKYADSDWCVSNNGEGGPLCTPEDETWDLCNDEATTSTKSKKKLLRQRDLGKKSKKGKSAKNKKNDNNKAYVNVCIHETVNGLETHSTECSDPFVDVRKAFGGKGGSESSAATVVASCGACTKDE